MLLIAGVIFYYFYKKINYNLNPPVNRCNSKLKPELSPIFGL